MKQLPAHYRYDWPVILLLAAISLAGAWLYRNFALDDAFITYRYARSLVNGQGFVYNLHEPVLGTTTPLYTLVLALLGKLTGQEIRLISHLVSALSLWSSGVILYYLGQDKGTLPAAAAALLFVSNPLLISAIGMETFFLIALLLAALISYLHDRLNLSGVLLGLLILTRYETVFMAGLLGLDFLIRRRRLPFWLVSTAAIVVVWLIYAWLTFGYVIPRSAVAKLTENEGYPFAIGAFIWWGVYAAQTGWYYLFPALALLGAYSALRYKREAGGYLLILAWTGIYFVAASFVAGSFSWYYGPLIPGFSILLAWGLEFLTTFSIAAATRFRVNNLLPHLWSAAFFVVISLSLVALQLSSWTRGWVIDRGQIVDDRHDIYRQAIAWLNEHAGPDESLASSEIGVIGYYSNLKIIDLYGLVTPGLTPRVKDGRIAMLNEAIALYRPDYLLTGEEVLIKVLQTSPDYRPVQHFGGDSYILYKRR